MPVLSDISSGRDLEETVIVDVADDEFGRFPIIRVQRRLVELTHQVLLKRFLGGDGIEEELALFLIFLRTGAVAARLRHVIAPFVVQFRQLIELGLEFFVCGGVAGSSEPSAFGSVASSSRTGLVSISC